MQLKLRQMSSEHHHLNVTTSRFQWNKFKDLLNFYVLLGVIPVVAISVYANVFIGPAKLAEIPADYEPKHWEYHKVR